MLKQLNIYNHLIQEKEFDFILIYFVKVDFKEIYPGSTPESIDYLNKTICFNPKKRLTINESLEHPLFSKVRNKKLEITCKQPIVLEFEKSLSEELTEEKLR